MKRPRTCREEAAKGLTIEAGTGAFTTPFAHQVEGLLAVLMVFVGHFLWKLIRFQDQTFDRVSDGTAEVLNQSFTAVTHVIDAFETESVWAIHGMCCMMLTVCRWLCPLLTSCALAPLLPSIVLRSRRMLFRLACFSMPLAVDCTRDPERCLYPHDPSASRRWKPEAKARLGGESSRSLAITAETASESHGSQGASSSGYPSSAPAATLSAAPPVEPRLPPLPWVTRAVASQKKYCELQRCLRHGFSPESIDSTSTGKRAWICYTGRHTLL